MKCRTNKVELRLSLSGIFSILHMEMINDKCGAAHHLLNQRARAGLRQNVAFWDLPVKPSPRLWAKRRFLGFARKTQPRLRAKRRFLGFARKMQPSVTGKMPFFEICP